MHLSFCHSVEEAALRDALKNHLAQEPTDENDEPQREQQKERFLQEFPELKKKLEDHIRKLRDLADHLDKVHKDCTISNVVSTSVSTTSGVLGILGLVLSPFTAGASLVLTATSAGLGVTSSLSSLMTTIVEESNRLSDESEASRLVGASMDILGKILIIMPKIRIKLLSTSLEFVDALTTFHQIRAFRRARSVSRATASTGSRSVRGVSSMTRGARIISGGFTSVLLAWDVYDLVNESVDLYDGAETESAGALRELAHKLEEKLQLFEQIYKTLKSDLPQ